MKNKDKLMLQKVLKYINEIEEFIKDYTKEQFNNDRKTINACVFNLSQIGELVGKLSENVIKENSNVEWRGLKGLRNRIVHDYEGVNLDMVWRFFRRRVKRTKNANWRYFEVEYCIKSNKCILWLSMSKYCIYLIFIIYIFLWINNSIICKNSC